MTSERTTNTDSDENAPVSSSGSGPQFEHQLPTTTDISNSHEDICHISTSSSSSSTQSNNRWFGEHSVADVDIVELTDWTGDLSNLDTGPEPMITVIEDESPERTFSEASHVTVSEVPADTDAAGAVAAASSSMEDDVTASVTEVEVMETDEIGEVAAESQADDHDITADIPVDETANITADVPVDETANIGTEEPVVTTQVCANYYSCLLKST